MLFLSFPDYRAAGNNACHPPLDAHSLGTAYFTDPLPRCRPDSHQFGPIPRREVGQELDFFVSSRPALACARACHGCALSWPEKIQIFNLPPGAVHRGETSSSASLKDRSLAT
jgi:hypothetical protein